MVSDRRNRVFQNVRRAFEVHRVAAAGRNMKVKELVVEPRGLASFWGEGWPRFGVRVGLVLG